MNLVIDIGNTCTKAAWFEDKKHVETIRLQESESPERFLNQRPFNKIIVSSVRKIDGELNNILRGTGRELMILDHLTPLPLKVVYETPKTLGCDRIAASVGAWNMFPQRNIMVIDMGTTITIDFVHASGEFRGGNISPGLHTRFKALHTFTGKLPLMGPDENFPDFGTSTRTAIIAGVQQGILYELEGYISAFEKNYPGCIIIATGGDSDFFVSRLKKTIFAEPELVLSGLNTILNFNLQQRHLEKKSN
jgi:type III pantothenate kinase